MVGFVLAENRAQIFRKCFLSQELRHQPARFTGQLRLEISRAVCRHQDAAMFERLALTRHAAGQAITVRTDALSMVLSESTGTITLFKDGSRVLTVKRGEG